MADFLTNDVLVRKVLLPEVVVSNVPHLLKPTGDCLDLGREDCTQDGMFGVVLIAQADDSSHLLPSIGSDPGMVLLREGSLHQVRRGQEQHLTCTLYVHMCVEVCVCGGD